MTADTAPQATAALPHLKRAPLAGLEDPVPLFAQAERVFHTAHHVVSAQAVDGGARLDIATQDGEAARLELTATRSGALRMRWALPATSEGTVRAGDGMVTDGADPDPAVRATIDEEAVTLATHAWSLTLDRGTCAWRLHRPDGTPLATQRTDDRAFVHWMSRPLGTSGGENLRRWSHESVALGPDDRLYGLGQQFGPLERRGTRVVQHNRDGLGSNSSGLTYHNTPFLWSSAGVGFVVHAAGRVMWEIGCPSYDTLTMGAAGDVLDLFLLVGDTPEHILRAHHRLLGAPPELPAWALGTWMSRCQYRSRDEVATVIRRLDEVDMPVDVIHLDPAWMRERRDCDNDHGADFDWDTERFGDAADYFAWLGEQGLHGSLWENPYALHDSRALRELTALGGIAQDPDGRPSPPHEAPRRTESFVVDLTAPAAREWWSAEHRRLLDLGAAAFKTDFAEGVRDDARFSDGRTGADIHNLYALLYNRLVFDTCREHGVEQPLVFGRSGWLGSHRYPLQWSGDSQCNWSDLRGAVRAGLSAALSGIAWWSCDIGGFYRLDAAVPEPELYARWAWVGLLAPVARFHGTGPREPYEYGDDACRAVVRAATLRYRLLPYLLAQAPQAAAGRPLMRPLVLADPAHEAGVRDEASWLLGDDLLVAPVLQPGGRRRVHLPPGDWHDWWTGETHAGGSTKEVAVSLDRTPLYQRAGSTIPLAAPATRVARALVSPRTMKAAADPYLG